MDYSVVYKLFSYFALHYGYIKTLCEKRVPFRQAWMICKLFCDNSGRPTFNTKADSRWPRNAGGIRQQTNLPLIARAMAQKPVGLESNSGTALGTGGPAGLQARR